MNKFTSLLVFSIIGGCAISGPQADWDLERGLIKEVRFPDALFAGTAATVHIRTLGQGCDKAGVTRSQVVEGIALVEPYDSFPQPGAVEICPDIELVFDHQVAITFPEPGQATIRVTGRFRRPGGPEEVASVERAYQVEP